MSDMLTFEITLLLFAAMLGIVLAKRIGQSAIVGEILLGVLIGPTLLGWVQYNEPVRVIAELGAIFMLFTVGLQCNMRQIYDLKNIAIACAGVIVPFFAGWYLSSLFGYTTIEGLFIGTALTATSIAITARILQERNMLSSSTAKTIIGAAVVDDVLGLIVLSPIKSSTNEASAASPALKIGVALLFVVLCIALKKPMNRLVSAIDAKFSAHNEHVGLFAAMVVAFGYAAIAQYIGLSSIIGAFLAGVTLEEFTNTIVREATHYLETVFAAIFFVSLGVASDFTSLGSAWIFAIALVVVAIITKLFGCFTIARLFGHNARESLSIGLGMVPRGEVAMIVGLIGLSSGIIGPAVYGTIILMAFVTTVLTPLALHWSLAKQER